MALNTVTKECLRVALANPSAATEVIDNLETAEAVVYSSSTGSITITPTGTGNAIIADGTGLLVGATSQLTTSNGDGSTDLVAEVQVQGTTKADSSILLATFSATATIAASPSVNFLKSAHATLGSNTVVVSGEILGGLNFFGADGTDFESAAASIQGVVDGTPGTGDMPGRIVFSTSADNGEALAEAVRITSTKDLRVNDGGGIIVGSTSVQATISDGDGATDCIPEVQVLGTTKADGSLLLMVNSATATSAAAPSLNFVKSAHATLGSNTVVVSGEVLGEVNFFGANGTDFESCGVSIRGVVHTTPGAADMPGRLSVFCSADGGETPLEKVRITGTTTTSATLQVGVAAASTGSLLLTGATGGTLTLSPLASFTGYTLTFPPDDGDAGEQLQTDGSGVLTFEAAGSLAAVKNVIGEVSSKAMDVLQKIVGTPVYEFQYKEKGRPTTGDYHNVYTGVMAEDMPEVMHHGKRIFSPVSAFGEACLAIKALVQEIAGLKTEIAGLKSKKK